MAPKKYRTQQLKVAPGMVNLSPENEKRAARESARVREVLESTMSITRIALEKMGLSEEAIDRAEVIYRATDKERLSKQIAAGDISAARENVLTEPQVRDPAGVEPDQSASS